MSAHDDGGPAFPHIDSGCGRFDAGMSLRDYFAAKALPAIVAVVSAGQHEQPISATHKPRKEWMAGEAYALADSMLKARNA